MKRTAIAFALFFGIASLTHAERIRLKVGEPFTEAHKNLYIGGWRADPLAHASSEYYFGLDRHLVQAGYDAVDFCTVGKSFCVLQYTKNKACLRLQTEGEDIRSMRVEHWSGECRERGTKKEEAAAPGDVRYIAQWRNDCENYEQCKGADAFLSRLKRKYAHDPAVMKILRSYQGPAEIFPRPGR